VPTLIRNGIGRAAARWTALDPVGRTGWYFPGCFAMAKLLGRYSLRCVLFHNVSDKESSFTRGLGVTIPRSKFEAALKFLTKHYTPVGLRDVLAGADPLPPRPVLVTFDDAYASVWESAAPLCHKLGVPAVFFVNPANLDNQQLALDNLVCHVANVFGLEAVSAAVRAVNAFQTFELHSLAQVFASFLPACSLAGREEFRAALLQSTRSTEHDLAAEAGLYLTSQQLRDLAAFDFEIGNHTYTHVNCRSLSREDLGQEIDRNKTVLEAISKRMVRSFSVPYGSSADLTPGLLAHLQRSGHEAIFLAESLANPPDADRFRLDRVSIHVASTAACFAKIEVLPRLRTIRNWMFGNSNGGPYRRNSHLEKESPTTAHRSPGKRVRTGTGVPGEIQAIGKTR
jgi:peptidoglycan/xylan/chitin deacetylase (PgdA/CDA1 family)